MNLFAAFNSDGYKLGHPDMYADGTQVVSSNLTPRSDRIYQRTATKYYDGKLVVIGHQGAVMEIVESWDSFFKMDKGIALARFKLLCDNYFGYDVIQVDRLSKLHDLGYLPLEIRTLDEGSKVKMGVPVLTIRNTVDHAFWLVNFLETVISNLTWKPSTTATIAAEYKAMLTDFAVRTGTPVESVAFQAHNFADRGMSGPEDAARSGFGHITSFLGSDSLGSVMYAQQYYGAGNFVAASVPATEHAVSTSNILRIEEELSEHVYQYVNHEQRDICIEMYNNRENPRLIAEIMFMYELMLKFPVGILSYVADSFDFWSLISVGLPYIKDVIMRREGNGITPGKLVIRPDSGDPADVICGLSNYEGRTNVTDAEADGALRTLRDIFGGTFTDKGYFMLDEHIGLIYGDSITTQRCLDILNRMEFLGFASGNAVFGVGSYTYQCVTRDTFGMAVKATYTEVNGKAIPIFKDPKTDSKKKSAKGLLYVGVVDGEYVLTDNVTREVEQSESNMLKIRFKDGQFYNQITLDEIRSKL